MSESILITGGAGFLGDALARRLPPDWTPVIFDNLHHGQGAPRGLWAGDVLDAAALEAAARGCRRAVHLASLAGVRAVCADPVATLRVALLGTAHFLEACRRAGSLERVVIVSSSEVHGPLADRLPEEAVWGPPPGEPRWSYAAGKLAAEHLAQAYARQYALPVVIVRPFNVYGPGQRGEGAVRTFARAALRGQPLQLHGGGSDVRAWCFVDDAVDGLLAALVRPEAVGGTFDLGNPEAQASARELAERIAALAGCGSPLVEVPAPAPAVLRRVPDIARARALLEFHPRVGLEEGLARTLDWLRRQQAEEG